MKISSTYFQLLLVCSNSSPNSWRLSQLPLQLSIKHMLRSGTSGKESACQCRRRCTFDPWVRKIPWNRKMAIRSSIAWKLHGQRSLAGCSPRGYKESGKTEQLNVYTQRQLWRDTGQTDHYTSPIASVGLWDLKWTYNNTKDYRVKIPNCLWLLSRWQKNELVRFLKNAFWEKHLPTPVSIPQTNRWHTYPEANKTDDRYIYLRLWIVTPRQLENDLLEQFLNTVAAFSVPTLQQLATTVSTEAWAQETGNVMSQS